VTLIGMTKVALTGLCLIAAAGLSAAGAAVDSADVASVAWALGAATAFAGAASAYAGTAGGTIVARRRSAAAAALAILGIVASAWIVHAAAGPALRGLAVVGDLTDRAPPVLAAVASGIGLALLALAAGQGGLVGPVTGRVIAGASILAAVTANPAGPHLLGAAPLGVVLLVAQRRQSRSKGVTFDENRVPGPGLHRGGRGRRPGDGDGLRRRGPGQVGDGRWRARQGRYREPRVRFP